MGVARRYGSFILMLVWISKAWNPDSSEYQTNSWMHSNGRSIQNLNFLLGIQMTFNETCLDYSNTVTIWMPHKFGIQMVQTCPAVKWSVVEWLSESQTINVCFMVKNIRFLNGPPNSLIRPFENRTKKSVPKCSDFRGLVLRWLLYQTFLALWSSVYEIKC